MVVFKCQDLDKILRSPQPVPQVRESHVLKLPLVCQSRIRLHTRKVLLL